MATPLTPDARLERILKAKGPYLYGVSRTGVTGRDASLAASAAPLVARVKARTATPVLLGFGVGRPGHVRAALAAGADGAISGSAVAEIIARRAADGRAPLAAAARRELAEAIRKFTRGMKGATR
jgi:tryptophan synthase alpha chain